jgi:hypothetical protein
VRQFPSEFVELDIIPGLERFCPEGPPVVELIARVMDLPGLAFERSFDLVHATMKNMRDIGKNVMIRSRWVEERYNIGWPPVGTWTAASNFGGIDEGEKLYTYLRWLLDGPRTMMRFAMNRASGDSLIKELPRNYMLEDMDRFRRLIEEIQQKPEWLAKLQGLDFDFVTETHELAGATIHLNLSKGTVQEGKREDFHDIIARTMCLP